MDSRIPGRVVGPRRVAVKLARTIEETIVQLATERLVNGEWVADQRPGVALTVDELAQVALEVGRGVSAGAGPDVGSVDAHPAGMRR